MGPGTRHSVIVASVLLASSAAYAVRAAEPGGSASGPGGSASEPDRPDPATFESGDLVWPKTEGQWVPLSKESEGQLAEEARRWEREKAELLSRLRADPRFKPGNPWAERDLERMSFKDFLARYEEGEPGSAGLGGGLPVYVGHVGIVLKSPGEEPKVVEAAPFIGVRVIGYRAWLDSHPDVKVWHARLKGASAEQRAAVVSEALQQVGKPYRFFNLDLADDSGFYCSKLAWFAINRALGLPPDLNPDPRRWFWFSPKQLMHSSLLQMLFEPGRYLLPMPVD